MPLHDFFHFHISPHISPQRHRALAVLCQLAAWTTVMVVGCRMLCNKCDGEQRLLNGLTINRH